MCRKEEEEDKTDLSSCRKSRLELELDVAQEKEEEAAARESLRDMILSRRESRGCLGRWSGSSRSRPATPSNTTRVVDDGPPLSRHDSRRREEEEEESWLDDCCFGGMEMGGV